MCKNHCLNKYNFCQSETEIFQNMGKKICDIDSSHLTSFLAWNYLEFSGPLCWYTHIPAKFHFRVAKFTSEFSTDYFRSAILFSVSVHWKSMVSSNVQSHLPWIYGDQITQSTSKFATIPFISFATGFLH